MTTKHTGIFGPMLDALDETEALLKQGKLEEALRADEKFYRIMQLTADALGQKGG